MKYLNLDEWSRREHFTFFQTRENPRISLTAQVDVGNICAYRNDHDSRKIRFTDCMYYAIMNSVNTVSEFKMRIIDLRPVEFEIIDAAFTYVAASSQLHSNCIAEYCDDFSLFRENVQAARERADVRPTLCPERCESQALVYMTCLKDVAFTSFGNPWGDPWVDTVPRVAFGKVDPQTKKMPVSIEALHSFIDGVHIAAFLRRFEEIVSDPAAHYAG